MPSGKPTTVNAWPTNESGLVCKQGSLKSSGIAELRMQIATPDFSVSQNFSSMAMSVILIDKGFSTWKS